MKAALGLPLPVVPNERSEEGPAFDFGLMKSEIPRP